MAPLHILISEKHYSAEGLSVPKKDAGSEYVALAEDGKIIGYYAIDKVKPTENAAFLELFEKKYGIKSVIVNPVKPQLWKNIETKSSSDETWLTCDDIIISENYRENSSAIQALWGGANTTKGDIFIVRPFMKTLLHFIIISRKIPERIVKGAVICSLPFLIQLFAASFGIISPQISSVALLMSFFMTVIYIFYAKPVSKNSI